MAFGYHQPSGLGCETADVSGRGSLAQTGREVTMSDLLLALPSGLTREQVRVAFDLILDGQVSETQTAAFLFGLRVRGETIDEVQGIADALLRASPALPLDGPLIDIVGTGGDRTGTINLSTPASVLVSAAGSEVIVVKHGNRGATTPTGSADLIEAWGVPLDLAPEAVAAVAHEVGITFCFAPRFHAALRHAAGARRALGVPTVMNVLGPLVNPARPQFQLVGVADPTRIELLSRIFESRGSSALVARGHDGLDKFTLSGPTDVTIVSGGRTSSLTVAPADVGLRRSDLATLRGEAPATNAQRLMAILDGHDEGPVAEAVALNAAAALALVGIGTQHELFIDVLREQVDACRELRASGAAGRKLRTWVHTAQCHFRATGNAP